MAQSHSSCLFPDAPLLLGRNFAAEGLLEMALRIFTLTLFDACAGQGGVVERIVRVFSDGLFADA